MGVAGPLAEKTEMHAQLRFRKPDGMKIVSGWTDSGDPEFKVTATEEGASGCVDIEWFRSVQKRNGDD